MMDRHSSSSLILISFVLALFCLLSSTAAFPTHPPSSSALLAADLLRSRGYSLFASVIVSLSIVSANFSGTVLAPPDFVFSSSAATFLNNRRPPPRPSIALLLYHTLKPPLVLTWPALASRADGDELRTLYNNNCLYAFRSPPGGDVKISSSPLMRNPFGFVQIRQPDLYVDDSLTVHGIDGVLDPAHATKCGDAQPVYPTAENAPRRVNRTFIDHAIKGLRRRGYNVVAAAMSVKKSEMLSLTSVTVFAVSDKHFFQKSGGFRYDFHHHVVPIRQRIADFATERVLATLAPNKTILVCSAASGGGVTANGVAVAYKELYHNRWIVVLSISKSLDDVIDSRPYTFSGESRNTAPSFSGEPRNTVPPFTSEPMNTPPSFSSEPRNTPPSFSDEARNTPAFEARNTAPPFSIEPRNTPPSFSGEPGNTTPSLSGEPRNTPPPFSGQLRNSPPPFSSDSRNTSGVASAYTMETKGNYSSIAPARSPSGQNSSASRGSVESARMAPETGGGEKWVSSSAPSPSSLEDMCANWKRIEGGDLFCQEKRVRRLQESEDLNGEHLEESQSYSEGGEDVVNAAEKVQIFDNVNIADDLFFYT